MGTVTANLVPSPAPTSVPYPLHADAEGGESEILEFFTAQINNDHTRKAYMNATRRFAALVRRERYPSACRGGECHPCASGGRLRKGEATNTRALNGLLLLPINPTLRQIRSRSEQGGMNHPRLRSAVSFSRSRAMISSGS